MARILHQAMDCGQFVGGPEVIQMGTGRSVPGSVQLAFARQGAKEQGESDDAGGRSDDSYSRHWCSRFKPALS